MTRASLILMLLCAGACEAPVYDDRIGVEGVAVDEGALAGTFAVVTQGAFEADLPLLGKQTGGGMTIYLVQRTHDAARARYTGTAQACRVINFELAGLSTSVPDVTVATVPPIAIEHDVQHGTGAIVSLPFREQWGLRDDVAPEDPLPTTVSDERVVDMEGDDKPGATVLTSGLVNGEVYIVQRKTLTTDGVVRSADEAFGLMTNQRESTILDATDDLLMTETERLPHPDPKENWWHELRVADGATCDDVRAGLDDQSISLLRPF